MIHVPPGDAPLSALGESIDENPAHGLAGPCAIAMIVFYGISIEASVA
jgi:hypothetical protein